MNKLKTIFSDFFRALRQVWFEVLGGIFLAFGVVFIVTAVQEYRKFISIPGYGISSLVLAVFFSGLMLLFALESFWKARKTR